MSIIKRFKDYLSDDSTSFRLDNLEVGESVQFNDVTDLAPFNLKVKGGMNISGGMQSSSQVLSDLPELKDMIFQIDYDKKTIKRIK